LRIVRSAPAASTSASSGPSRNAAATMRSASPRARASSVVEDLIVTRRSGGAGTVTVSPQLVTVTGKASVLGAGASSGPVVAPGALAPGAEVADVGPVA